MTREEALEALEALAGKRLPGPDDDLLGALGIEGDDANEFIEAYAEACEVDMSGFLWYFHYNADEPPGSRRVLPVLSDGTIPPYHPVTVENLVASAMAGHWVWDYPEHTIRHSRVFRAAFSLLLLLVFVGAVWIAWSFDPLERIR